MKIFYEKDADPKSLADKKVVGHRFWEPRPCPCLEFAR